MVGHYCWNHLLAVKEEGKQEIETRLLIFSETKILKIVRNLQYVQKSGQDAGYWRPHNSSKV